MQNFRTYQLALALVKSSQTLRLKAPYKDQFERAVLSIALNLAEGSAKPTRPDQKKFYYIAMGSLREVQCLLALFGETTLQAEADKVAASLYKLCKA